MALFKKKEKPKPDFSSVKSGSSTGTSGIEQTPSVRMYTVKPGDSLSAIAKREYGDAGAWRRIYEANRDQIENPDLIHPGQELKLPAEGGAS